jgi:hypothetical protein
MTYKLKKLLISTVIVAFLVSCSTPVYKLYPGELLPANKIAVLVKSLNTEGSIYIDLVNGVKPQGTTKKFYGNPLNADFRIELKPGKHSLSVRYYSYEYSSRKNKIIYFNAEAGKTYQVNASIDTKKMDWISSVELYKEPPPVAEEGDF